jgi:hypothetical protein
MKREPKKPRPTPRAINQLRAAAERAFDSDAYQRQLERGVESTHE